MSMVIADENGVLRPLELDDPIDVRSLLLICLSRAKAKDKPAVQEVLDVMPVKRITVVKG